MQYFFALCFTHFSWSLARTPVHKGTFVAYQMLSGLSLTQISCLKIYMQHIDPNKETAGTVNLIGQYHWHILLCSHPGFSSSQMIWLLSTIWRHVCSTDFLLCLTYKTSCSFQNMVDDLWFRIWTWFRSLQCTQPESLQTLTKFEDKGDPQTGHTCSGEIMALDFTSSIN